MRRIAHTTALVGVVVVVLMPWTVRNWVAFGQFVPISTSLGNTIAGTYNAVSAAGSPPGAWVGAGQPGVYPAIVNRHPFGPANSFSLTSAALGYISRHPEYVAVAAYWNTLHLLDLTYIRHTLARSNRVREPRWTLLVADIALWAVLVLALVGAVVAARTHGERWVWLTALLLYVPVALMGAATNRFRGPVDPFFVLLAAAGSLAIVDAVARLRPVRAAVAGSALTQSLGDGAGVRAEGRK